MGKVMLLCSSITQWRGGYSEKYYNSNNLGVRHYKIPFSLISISESPTELSITSLDNLNSRIFRAVSIAFYKFPSSLPAFLAFSKCGFTRSEMSSWYTVDIYFLLIYGSFSKLATLWKIKILMVSILFDLVESIDLASISSKTFRDTESMENLSKKSPSNPFRPISWSSKRKIFANLKLS